MDMDEVFPVLAGVVVGLAIHHITSTRLRILIVAASSLVFGAVASFVSGELAVSWVYLVIDAAQVFVAASLTAVLAAFWRRRPWRLRS
jgi:hypothetical protein